MLLNQTAATYVRVSTRSPEEVSMRASSIMLMAAVVAAPAACAGPGDTAPPSPASATLAGD